MTPAPAAIPPVTPDRSERREQQARSLAGAKRFATLLFALMVVVYVLSRSFENRLPLLAWVAAFAEAAMVGALADWFAVVALFRHPMGVPLPHTAIIPRNKGRIADNLGAFITNNFLRTEVILQRILEFDPGRRLAVWLSRRESAEAVAGYAVRALAYALHSVEDDRVQRFLQGVLIQRLRGIDVAPLAGRMLELISQDGRHQRLLDQLLLQVRLALAEPDMQEKIAALIAREFAGWRKALLDAVRIDTMIGDYSGKKLLAVVMRLLDEVEADPEHPLRRRFDVLLGDFIVRLKTDPGFSERGAQLRDELLARPELAQWLTETWMKLRAWVEADLQEPQSVIRARLATGIADLGGRLRSDPAMQAWVNEQALAAAKPLCEEHRGNIGRFVSDQVKAWDEDFMVREFELNIGSDLQYIRINGTIIGGLAGLLIYAATLLLRG
jgi:uncharacterized membrane-anchored protein YjiN (DUF445 family)